MGFRIESPFYFCALVLGEVLILCFFHELLDFVYFFLQLCSDVPFQIGGFERNEPMEFFFGD